ncbi:MAG: 7,8-didemethyl-8-hydroxy-5-deazariboflavin synthase subunit CofG [Candidatus Hodarchaeota archaeon]
MTDNACTKNPPESISKNQAVDFLRQNRLNMLDKWRKSAQSIANSVYQHQITFTTNVFIPLTFLCRNACHYCGYRRSMVPKGQEYLKPEKIKKILDIAKQYRVSEVLITMGDKPEKKHAKAKKWLKKHGFDSTIEYTCYTAKKALKHELLPHINAGTLTFDELTQLREVSASIGLMLETISSRLTHSGLPHDQSPDKHPKRRMRTIVSAGKLKIPFTSGILVGIGETPEEIVESLFALKNVHQEYQHLQEVIIQNFQPQKNSLMANSPPPTIELMEKILIVTRHILPPEVSIQIPPNLVKGYEHRFISAGMSDWGGISSISSDYINPDHDWPSISKLEQISQKAGYRLKERLPVYPRYINLEWLSAQVYKLIMIKKLNTRMVMENGVSD